MIIPIEDGLYWVRHYGAEWTVARWRTDQKVPWLSGKIGGAWFVIGSLGPHPFPTFAELGERITPGPRSSGKPQAPEQPQP